MTSVAAKPRKKVARRPAEKPVAADPVARELNLIAAKHGGLLPARAVVKWARSHPKSELHKRFEWSDSEAADKWRLQQARVLIASVTIEPRPNQVVRAYVNLKSDRVGDQPAYRRTVNVMSDAEQRAELLQMAKDELGRVRRTFATLTELASVWHAIDAATASEAG